MKSPGRPPLAEPTSSPPGASEAGAWMRRETPGFIACLLAAVLVTFLAIHWSSTHGKLTHDIQYDDVLHFVDALDLYLIWENQGVGAAAREFASHPTLAPFSTLAGVAAFRTFGLHPWAPYVFNGVVVFLTLVTVWTITSRLPLTARIATLVWFMTIPIFWSAAGDYKPNFLSSLFILVAVYALVEWFLLDGPRILLPVAAAGFALGILAKPPFFPFVFFLMGASACGLSILRRLSPERTWLPRQTGWKIYLAAALLFLGFTIPYAIAGGNSVVHMLLTHIAPGGKYNEEWTTLTANRSTWTYFLTGGGGQMIGPQLWTAVALWIGALIALIRSPRTYRLVLLAGFGLLVLWYIPPTLTEVKHRFTGLLFQLGLLLTPIYLLAIRCGLSRSTGLRSGVSVGIVAVCLVSLPMATPLKTLGAKYYFPEQGAEQKAVARAILDRIKADGSDEETDEPRLTLFTTGLINSNTLDWVARSEGYPIRIPPSGNIVTFQMPDRETEQSDYILMADPTALGTYQWHVLTREAEVMDQWLANRKDFVLVESFPTSTGGAFRLYQRKAPETQEASPP